MTAAIIQARMTSTRLPGKVLLDICGKPCLQRVIERLRASKRLDDVIVACTTNGADDAIVALCDKLNCHYYRGSEDDVLSRVLEAAKAFSVDVVVEVTSDCPLIYAGHVDALISIFSTGDYDFVSNVGERTFPRGFDIRVCSAKTLERVNVEVDNPIDRQHCLTRMYLNPKGKQNYKQINMEAPASQYRPDIEITLDTTEDLELIRFIYGFEGQQIIGIINDYPMMYSKVKEIHRKDYFSELQEWYAKQDAPDISIPAVLSQEPKKEVAKTTRKPIKNKKTGAKNGGTNKRGRKPKI
jgi:spore coat polysaccharide biosynthesis protein SpsF